ncbi:hypothetical protein [Kitasatospora phosalacinea]|uniref:Uncharacterized protein n=1 Tax=Kitasatospora phosalacinea TaxID=2065 RepID=A0A9W6PR69_9ACTN|nr:hypothetical protein [Kitasatospora phosalacinea]GLW59317.1 hypothetical protein Kpho01_73270 [Kitasatospora phosalacinea]
MNSSSSVRPLGLGAGLTALIPHPGSSGSPDHPVLNTAGGRAAARLLQLRTVEVPVPLAAAAAELVGLLLDDEDPVTRQAAAAVLERLNTAVAATGAGL